jgi:hypothetical protein
MAFEFICKINLANIGSKGELADTLAQLADDIENGAESESERERIGQARAWSPEGLEEQACGGAYCRAVERREAREGQ